MRELFAHQITSLTVRFLHLEQLIFDNFQRVFSGCRWRGGVRGYVFLIEVFDTRTAFVAQSLIVDG